MYSRHIITSKLDEIHACGVSKKHREGNSCQPSLFWNMSNFDYHPLYVFILKLLQDGILTSPPDRDCIKLYLQNLVTLTIANSYGLFCITLIRLILVLIYTFFNVHIIIHIELQQRLKLCY